MSVTGWTTPYYREHLLRAGHARTPVPWSGFVVALTLSVPSLNAGVEQLVETNQDSYERQPYGAADADWRFTEGDVASTAVDVLFPRAEAPWGTMHGWAMLDEAELHVLAVGVLVTPLRVMEGVKPRVFAGGVAFSLRQS